MDELLSIYELSTAEWSHADGVPKLFERLGLSELRPADTHGEQCLSTLLNSASEQSAQAKIDITSGAITGSVVGAALGAALGVLLWQPLGSRTPLDQFGFIFAGLLAGVLLGCVLGAFVMATLMPGRIAFNRLRRTTRDYEIDPLTLKPLAGRFARRVSRAVDRLPESVR